MNESILKLLIAKWESESEKPHTGTPRTIKLNDPEAERARILEDRANAKKDAVRECASQLQSLLWIFGSKQKGDS